MALRVHLGGGAVVVEPVARRTGGAGAPARLEAPDEAVQRLLRGQLAEEDTDAGPQFGGGQPARRPDPDDAEHVPATAAADGRAAQPGPRAEDRGAQGRGERGT